jgi:isocitrate dehydrogenase
MLPASSCVTLVGSIAWAGAVIYKKYLEAYAFRQYVKGLEIQAEHLQVIADAAKKKINLDIEAEAKLIQNEYFAGGDSEQLNRLKLSIKESSKLIKKGVEIKPALTAPEKISNLFPKYKPLELLESKIKKIEN